MWLAIALWISFLLLAIPSGLAVVCTGLPSSATPGQLAIRTVTVKDVSGVHDRNYGVRLPKGYTGSGYTPVLFYFHWYGAEWPWEIYKINMLADENGFILVSPEGMMDGQEGGHWRSWNVGSAGRSDICTAAAAPASLQYTSCQTLGLISDCNCFTCHDDVAFVAQVHEDLTENYCIDEASVYGFGLSNGGMLLYTLLAGLADRGLAPHFKGVVVFEGGIFQDQVQEVAGTAVFVHHGRLDTKIPISGGEGDDHWLWAPLEDILGRYAGANGCLGPWQTLSTPFDHWADKFDGCWQMQGCDLQPVVKCLYSGDHNVFYDAYSPALLYWQINMIRKAWDVAREADRTIASSTSVVTNTTTTTTVGSTTTTLKVAAEGSALSKATVPIQVNGTTVNGTKGQLGAPHVNGTQGTTQTENTSTLSRTANTNLTVSGRTGGEEGGAHNSIVTKQHSQKNKSTRDYVYRYGPTSVLFMLIGIPCVVMTNRARRGTAAPGVEHGGNGEAAPGLEHGGNGDASPLLLVPDV